MNKTDLQIKLDQASEIVESWPDWKKNSLKESFKSRNSKPREVVELNAEPVTGTGIEAKAIVEK